ncbi:hypothetical protein AB4254_07935 [Vibrio breoganii]
MQVIASLLDRIEGKRPALVVLLQLSRACEPDYAHIAQRLRALVAAELHRKALQGSHRVELIERAWEMQRHELVSSSIPFGLADVDLSRHWFKRRSLSELMRLTEVYISDVMVISEPSSEMKCQCVINDLKAKADLLVSYSFMVE